MKPFRPISCLNAAVAILGVLALVPERTLAALPGATRRPAPTARSTSAASNAPSSAGASCRVTRNRSAPKHRPHVATLFVRR